MIPVSAPQVGGIDWEFRGVEESLGGCREGEEGEARFR
jgi:hypothetical protein